MNDGGFVLFRPGVHAAAVGRPEENAAPAADEPPSFVLFHPEQHKRVPSPLDGWACRRRCEGAIVDGKAAHSWYCDYWRDEGKDATPF